MDYKDRQAKQREYQKAYHDKHHPYYTHKYGNESRMSAYSRYAADVLIPIQNRIDTEGFINGTKC